MNVTSIIALILSVASLAGLLVLKHTCAAPIATPSVPTILHVDARGGPELCAYPQNRRSEARTTDAANKYSDT